MVARYSRHTHVAFADESRHNVGRYRSLGLVTCAREAVDALTAEAAQLLASSNVHELKWSLLNGARDRHAAEKVITWAVDCAAARRLAIDALVWDTHDARHAVMRRDDAANLHRMYHWLLTTTLRRPGLTGATWLLCPDENGLMHWASVHDVRQRRSAGYKHLQRGALAACTSPVRHRADRADGFLDRPAHPGR